MSHQFGKAFFLVGYYFKTVIDVVGSCLDSPMSKLRTFGIWNLKTVWQKCAKFLEKTINTFYICSNIKAMRSGGIELHRALGYKRTYLGWHSSSALVAHRQPQNRAMCSPRPARQHPKRCYKLCWWQIHHRADAEWWDYSEAARWRRK